MLLVSYVRNLAYLKVTKIFYDFRSDLDRVSFFVYIYDPLNVNFCIWDHTRAEVITSSCLNYLGIYVSR